MPANHYFVADHQAAAVHYPSTASTPGLFGSAYEWFVRVGLAAKGPAGRLSC